MSQTTAARPAREYETIYVLRPDTPKDTAEKVATRVEEAVAREGGKLTLVENWGRRVLAYPVSKHRRGVYVYLKYLGGGAAVSEVERNLRMVDEVLKFQTVLVRDGIDVATVTIDPEAVKFEAVEPPAEAEEDISLERSLGLVDPPEGERKPRGDFDDYSDGPDFGQGEEDAS